MVRNANPNTHPVAGLLAGVAGGVLFGLANTYVGSPASAACVGGLMAASIFFAVASGRPWPVSPHQVSALGRADRRSVYRSVATGTRLAGPNLAGPALDLAEYQATTPFLESQLPVMVVLAILSLGVAAVRLVSGAGAEALSLALLAVLLGGYPILLSRQAQQARVWLATPAVGP